jgi:hypothetical protein
MPFPKCKSFDLSSSKRRKRKKSSVFEQEWDRCEGAKYLSFVTERFAMVTKKAKGWGAWPLEWLALVTDKKDQIVGYAIGVEYTRAHFVTVYMIAFKPGFHDLCVDFLTFILEILRRIVPIPIHLRKYEGDPHVKKCYQEATTNAHLTLVTKKDRYLVL